MLHEGKELAVSDYENYVNEAEKLNEKIMKRYSQIYGKVPLRDGIYSPKVYFEKDRKRICIILKEINGIKNDKWDPVSIVENDYCIYGSVGNKPAKAIVNMFKETALREQRDIDGCSKDTIPGIAYINLSKLAGTSKTNETRLRSTVKATGDLLWKQLELIDADIYICGGTFQFLWNLLADENTWPYLLESNGTAEKINGENLKRLSFYEFCLNGKNKMFVQIYHPSYRNDSNLWSADTGKLILDVYESFANGKLKSLKKWKISNAEI